MHEHIELLHVQNDFALSVLRVVDGRGHSGAQQAIAEGQANALARKNSLLGLPACPDVFASGF
eukprot:1021053-Alexandrium_andersonii.AAC.1